MTPIVQLQTELARCATVVDAARWALLLACALVWVGICPTRAAAQSPPPSSPSMRDAFSDVHRKMDDQVVPAGSFRVAQTNQPSAKAKAEQTQVKKNAATTTSKARRSPVPTPPQANTENLPLPPMKDTLPLAGGASDSGLQLTEKQGLITLIVRDKSLSQVLALIAQTQDLNIVASNDIDAMISITLRDVPIEEALSAILSVANYTWVKRSNIILITSMTDAANLPADVQGRQIQVFDLDYASAVNVAETVTKFLSPIGQVTVCLSSPTNNRQTQERVVVEDTPESISRIGEYISQIDQAPRQVLIEAHVLEVKLDDMTRTGVNLSKLISISGSDLSLSTTGFANKDAPQAFLATLTGGSLEGVIELLETSTDSKSLGSPKLLVLNEQEARIQVGETIYYSQVTTTETSSQQGAGSVEAGVILRITPRITRDNRVLLHVMPEISRPGKRETPDLPPNISKTTLATDIMLNDNQGMVIGGLINEHDITEQAKVPYLGNVKGLGFLFRRSEVTKQRSEIIVALVPRIQPYCPVYHNYEEGEIVKASVPLFHGALCRTDRPWDPVLPDGKRVSYPLIPQKYRPSGHYHDLGKDYVVPPIPLPTQEMLPVGPIETAPFPVPLPAGADPRGPVFLDEEESLPTNEEVQSGEYISDQQ